MECPNHRCWNPPSGQVWTKLDDGFPSHPKVLALGADAPNALSVWLAGACYTSRYITKGFVPAAAVQGPGLTPEQALGTLHSSWSVSACGKRRAKRSAFTTTWTTWRRAR